MQHTFLMEIGTEDLPSKTLRVLAETLANSIVIELNTINISHGKVSWFATPRRLAVKIETMDHAQHDSTIEKRGPSISQAFNVDGKPTKEAERWAHCCGITVDQAERFTTNKGTWLFYRTSIKGQPVHSVIGAVVSRAIGKLSTHKMMRWGDKNIQFIRPVHTITLMLDDSVIPGNILGVDVDRILLGHRFMGDRKISLNHADHYLQVLLSRGHVIADYYQRKETIRRDIEKAAQGIGGLVDLNDDLLEQITSLVEWPVVLIACFEVKFLALPIEILIYIIKDKQKCFPVYTINGKLLPYFLFVANIESKDPKQIIAGIEKVLHPLLVDAEFFFNIDRKIKLEDRLPCLNKVLFQKELGTLRDKSNRIEILASIFAGQIGTDVKLAARGGLLSKCDLITNMVFEFTGTQGVMGMYYARHDGEPESVALAQKEQYHPRFSGDTLPTTLVSCAVAIADKMDNLAGIFGIGQQPNGDKDPFALRRAALGVLRIIIEKQLPLDLQIITEKAVCLYGMKLTNVTVVEDIINFMLTRFRAWYQEQGYSVNVIQAVLACRPTKPIDFDARVRAIKYFCTLKEATSLILVNKRISNILSKSDETVYESLQMVTLNDPVEIELATNLISLRKKLKPLLEANRYHEALTELLVLCEPVDIFFKSVQVMVDNRNVRINRLTLLNQLYNLFLQIADISLL